MSPSSAECQRAAVCSPGRVVWVGAVPGNRESGIPREAKPAAEEGAFSAAARVP